MKSLIIILFLISFYAKANEFTFEVLTGTAFDLPVPLHINSNGQDINIIANYSTRSFVPAPYYDLKVGYWNDKTGWELELLHDKIYLDNINDQIQDFRCTFGYNMLFLNRGYKLNDWLIFRLGISPLIAHPMNTINGESYGYNESNTQYILAGITFQVSLSAKRKITKNTYVTIENKLTNAYGQIPVYNGYAEVPNIAIHILGGIGLNF